MKKNRTKFKILTFLIFLSVLCIRLNAQTASTRIKTEYQYTDYLKYQYPDPVYFEYPDIPYTQLRPYIADFPEHRFLFRIIHSFDYKTALTVKYQFSDMDTDSKLRLFAADLDRRITDQLSFSFGTQHSNQKNLLSGWMFEGGLRYDFAGFTIISPHFSYYNNKDVSSEGNKSSAYSFSLLVRQAINDITAVQFKYSHFHSTGELGKFNSNTYILWLSRYFNTETAVHLSMRYHNNSINVKSYSPGLEIVQYLNWASIIRFMYRYYNKAEGSDIGFGQLENKSLYSNSFALVFEYLLKKNLTISGKYRFYFSNRNIKMNTYLLGLEQLINWQ